MKISSNYKFREIAGCYYVIPVGNAEGTQKDTFQLTETAAWIWKQTETDISEEEIAQKMTQEYDVGLPQARAAVKQFLSELRRQGMMDQD